MDPEALDADALRDAVRVADRMWSNGEEDLDEIVAAVITTYLEGVGPSPDETEEDRGPTQTRDESWPS
jgi:hypothetical protein